MQLVSQFEGVESGTALLALEDVPQQYEHLNAYNVRKWLMAQSVRPSNKPLALPEPTPEPKSESEKDRVAKAHKACTDALKSHSNMWEKPWPKIKGKPVPPNLVMGDDGLLHPQAGKYTDNPSYFGKS